jgi:hypothetical protein
VNNVLPALIDELVKREPPCLVPDVLGMTAPKNRLLLNRLVKALPPEEAYLEIGIHTGATVISALVGNRNKTAYACDDFSGFREVYDPEIIFRENWKRHEREMAPLTLFKESCWTLSTKEKPFEKPIGVYFYDGDHEGESHTRAIVEFARFLAPESIIIIDDWNWLHVRGASWRGIAKVMPKRLYFREVLSAAESQPVDFWNGIGAFHIVR